MIGPHERFSGGLNKTQLLKSNIQKDVYMATYLATLDVTQCLSSEISGLK